MKPRIFFPVLFAAAGLVVLLCLLNSIASPVAGLPASTGPGSSSAPPQAITAPITLPWQAVAPGIDYVQLTLTNPANNVYIARMRRDELTATLDTSIGSGYIADGQRETVSQQAARYDQAINYWGQAPLTPTWGSRNDVVVAINGFYYNKNTGYPWNGMIQSGWYIKRFDDLSGLDGFAWKLDRSAFIGQCSDHPDAKQLITSSDGYSQIFDGINITRTNHNVVVYTPQYATNTGTNATGTEVQVQLSRPLLIIPSPHAVTGTITAIYTDTGSTPIPFDSVVLSAGKAITEPMWSHLQVGQLISISQEITPYKLDCNKKDPAVDWGKTYASLGGGYYFLHNGIVRHYGDAGATDRNPRTAIVYDNDYVYFVVVDGRSWPSQGMTIDELATFVSDTIATPETLTQTFGIAQDGGGSSTMVVNGQVKNNTLCNNVFCTHFTFLPIIERPAAGITTTESDDSPVPAPTIHSNLVDAVTAERYVANGVMMLLVQPMQASTTFTATQLVKAGNATQVRQGPGTNYAPLANISNNTTGTIVAHPLNGVLAKGSFWWKVDFGGGKVGWVAESDLEPVADY